VSQKEPLTFQYKQETAQICRVISCSGYGFTVGEFGQKVTKKDRRTGEVVVVVVDEGHQNGDNKELVYDYMMWYCDG